MYADYFAGIAGSSLILRTLEGIPNVLATVIVLAAFPKFSKATLQIMQVFLVLGHFTTPTCFHIKQKTNGMRQRGKANAHYKTIFRSM